ncbi:hypothetical protein DPMN_051453 [Dreissena polymorpha]|uniref:Uncharacterized protein n=1 Tax=Dreissena polymorpha TaxID=45954 RepID=A0A9D4HM54_DREPO|nr:hypothetical protein DPMN_051453 [Dreissena polymorpha]
MDVTPEVEVPMDVTPEVPEIPEAYDISIISEISVESRSDEVQDRTFNISHREIEQPNMPLEDSVRECPLDAVIPEDGPITYDVVRLFRIWEQYEDDETTTTQLLRACSRIAGLGPDTSHDQVHDKDEV